MTSDCAAKVNEVNESVTISIQGVFSFPLYKKFREITTAMPNAKRFIIDLAATTYIDSSALGMLLFLREQVDKSTTTIELINCRPEIRKILSIAHFDKMFEIT